ncbi:alpha/beta fold hydrolase [Bradyrhizobium sp.]|uniref:alpha/beta fold hydrolase n=1 Tax=Bradyrhizobium sp. TaxID=376 RepID=UPI0026059EF0|nr:alpha/beta fold hydrolase [Bradyrhizobium sp.]
MPTNGRSFRVIDTGIRGGRANIAFDQALIDAHKARQIPDTIRFLRFRPSALVGIHQILSHEVRLDYCRNKGIEIGRRITGGGGLYLDEGQIGWELVFHRSSLRGMDLGETTRRICESAARGLNKLGIPARYRPRNDIEVDGRKISGTGGFFDGDTLFYQGTLLIDFDPAEMIAALKVPVEKLAKRDLASARQRVITMREILRDDLPDLSTIYQGLLEGLAEGLGIEPQWGEVTRREEELADRLYRDEIGRDEFVEMVDAPEADDTLVSATLTRRGGSLRADLRLEGPGRTRIREALITGDFFVTPPRVIFDLEAALRGVELNDAGAVTADFFTQTPAEFVTLSPSDIRDAVVAATQQLTFVAAGHVLRGHRIAAAQPHRPPLVLLHDALGCVRLWRDLPERLADATGCSVLVYDRWGSGDSAPLVPSCSAHYLREEALRSLPDVIKATTTQRPILIGHSDGAAIALMFAGAYPDQVAGVVAIAPHLFREQRTVEGIAAQIRDFEQGDLKARLARYHGGKTDRLFGRLVDAWTGDEPRDWDIKGYVGRIRCPVLAIQGMADEFFTRAQLDALCELVPQQIETLLLNGCSHAPHQQATSAVVEAITRFIGRVSRKDDVAAVPSFT